jgi:hypothetical protein
LIDEVDRVCGETRLANDLERIVAVLENSSRVNAYLADSCLHFDPPRQQQETFAQPRQRRARVPDSPSRDANKSPELAVRLATLSDHTTVQAGLSSRRRSAYSRGNRVPPPLRLCIGKLGLDKADSVQQRSPLTHTNCPLVACLIHRSAQLHNLEATFRVRST